MKIAISGKMQAGKTTCADYLCDEYGFDKFSFAEPLKQRLEAAGVPSVQIRRNKPPLVRALMQVFGQVMREVDPGYWINQTLEDLRHHQPEFVVVDDLRFRNEAEALRDLGWVLVRVERKGWPPFLSEGSTDVSEVDLDDYDEWDYIITAADGEIDKLYSAIDQIIKKEERE